MFVSRCSAQPLCIEGPKARTHTSPAQRAGFPPLQTDNRANGPMHPDAGKMADVQCIELSALDDPLIEYLGRWPRLVCPRAFGPHRDHSTQERSQARARRFTAWLAHFIATSHADLARLLRFRARMNRAQSSARSPAGHIFTSFGSKRPSTSTRSVCAAITCAMSL